MLVGIGSMEGSSHVSRGIAATKSSSSKRTKSGERRISVGSDPSKITRQSETFRIPEEARRSKPSIEASSFVSETVRCQVPTSVKLLSLPTPHQEFEPARHLETRPSPRFTPRRLSKLQEVGNAVALFVFLIATSVIAVRLVAVALFG
jgi:hypothetical protein